MFIVRNMQENSAGNLDCEILIGCDWVVFLMSPSDEYKLSEESDWPDIKPCPQSEKDAYQTKQEQEKINRSAQAYLSGTDWLVVRGFDTGAEIPEDVKVKRQEARDQIK